MNIFEEMWHGSDLSVDTLAANVANSFSPVQLAKSMALLITKQPLVYFRPHLGGSAVTRFVRQHPEIKGGVLNAIATTNWKITSYAIELYESNYLNVRNTLNDLHMMPREHRVPHLDILIATYMRNTGQDCTKLNSPLYKSVLAEILGGNDFTEWFWNIVDEGKVPLKQYAGQTNTIFGMYNGMFDWRSGVNDVEHYIDLGGGFSTPEISVMTGKPFVSYDLIAPTLAEELRLPFKIAGREEFMSDTLTEGAYQKLRDQRHVPFDVYEGDFPDGKSHVIVSTGFMSSTVNSLSSHVDPDAPGCETMMRTTLEACHTVSRLVMRGGPVQLISIGRPQWRTYENTSLHIQFDHGRAKLIQVSKGGMSDFKTLLGV